MGKVFAIIGVLIVSYVIFGNTNYHIPYVNYHWLVATIGGMLASYFWRD